MSTTTLPPDPATQFPDYAPTVYYPTWLPTDSGFGWLDQLSREHLRLLTQWEDAAHAEFQIKHRFELEDQAAERAEVDAAREGVPVADKLPHSTPADEREAELAVATRHKRAQHLALLEFIRDASAALEENADGALAGLASEKAAAEEARRAAEALLAEAAAKESEVWQIGRWVERNAGRQIGFSAHALRYLPWPQVQRMKPPPESTGGLQIVEIPEMEGKQPYFQFRSPIPAGHAELPDGGAISAMGEVLDPASGEVASPSNPHPQIDPAQNRRRIDEALAAADPTGPNQPSNVGIDEGRGTPRPLNTPYPEGA